MAASTRRSLAILLLLLSSAAALVLGNHHLRTNEVPLEKRSSDSVGGGGNLPVFFFHGLGSDAHSGDNLRVNLTADGRVFNALTFCQSMCSGKALYKQVQDAIAAVKLIVSSDAKTYKDGYIFMGLSQGGLIARTVVEEWDGHNVKTLISLAGPQNGLFYGPQQSDFLALAVLSVYGPQAVDPRLFDFAKFTPADYSGKMQRAIAETVLFPYMQNELSLIDMLHMPTTKKWLETNPFLAKTNNLNVCGVMDASCRKDQARRRTNFLKLRTAHFFGSPQDDFISPWQSSILGEYAEVRTTEQIETLFSQFRVLDARKTAAYTKDTYGLQALDKRGGLFLHAVPNVGHSCWVRDYVTADKRLDCKFQPVYDAHLYPVLRDPLRCAKALAHDW